MTVENQVRVHVTSLVNSKKIRKEKRNGRDVIVVPSCTLPDNVVMNGIRYPAEEISKSYMTLNRTPAPFDHPMVNGEFVSAFDPEGLNIGYIGAWNDNARQEKGRVLLDKIIDVEIANQSENGKAVLEAIEEGKPIHTSTGLSARLEKLSNSEDGADFTAHDFVFDHDAILLNATGAATPEQGVGMLVNGKKIPVINSSLEEDADRELDWQIQSLMRAVERKNQVPVMERIKKAIVEAFSTEVTASQTEENAEMANSEELGEIKNSLEALTTKLDGFVDTLTNGLKPLEGVAQIVTDLNNAAKTRLEAEKTSLVNSVVKAGVLTEEAAKTLSVEALTELNNNSKVKTAKNARGEFTNSDEAPTDEFKDYDLNNLDGSNEKGGA